ncbi:MAG: hypothetical protein F4X92_09020, partial [Gammaproteobacteria bacterium]|nr:hypothetical protein [Gammaproteobacteria bacterium]
IHGDRMFSDDPAIISGLGWIFASSPLE